MAEKLDYGSWSHEDLVRRVCGLEEQLRAQNARHHSFAGAKKKVPKKAPKPFDPSRYSTRLIALKFAYLGGNYNGFEHHTNNTTPLPTVEEELFRALKKTRLISPPCKEGQSEDDVCWDGCEYSKCGRTDKGVSAFGQVIGLRVRSARPLERTQVDEADSAGAGNASSNGTAGPEDPSVADLELGRSVSGEMEPPSRPFDPVRDELPYIQALNRVLPPDIRVLAWCPDPPPGFNARFSCKERRYRYFFTNPAYVPLPGSNGRGESWLDIAAMREAAKRYEGLHDFRNFCKIDASKQITDYSRRIFHADIHAVRGVEEPGSFAYSSTPATGAKSVADQPGAPQMFYFEVRGSAFLWHQVRHLVAILFLVGQGYEKPSIVDDLLDTRRNPTRPVYDMASDAPLVLWDCIFPTLSDSDSSDHAEGRSRGDSGYEDAMRWVSVGDEAGGPERGSRPSADAESGKYGHGDIMEDLWALWRKRKIEEVLAGSLMNVVAGLGNASRPRESARSISRRTREVSVRIFDGSETPRPVGKYVPVMQRSRMEAPEAINARYAVRKGLGGHGEAGGMNADE